MRIKISRPEDLTCSCALPKSEFGRPHQFDKLKTSYPMAFMLAVGGNIALATAVAGMVEVLSIVTLEANPIALICERGRANLCDAYI
jgi:hypothetical protein